MRLVELSQIIRFADLSTQLWKNGGGTTTEIYCAPKNSTFDNFFWRVSVAEVSSNGPFSLFPDIDRTLIVISGEGIELSLNGQPPVSLKTSSEPFAFDGGVPAAARLFGGNLSDVNIMTRRGQALHKVRRLSGAHHAIINTVSAITLLFCLDRAVEIMTADGPAQLGPLDTLLIDQRGQTLDLTSSANMNLLYIEIDL